MLSWCTEFIVVVLKTSKIFILILKHHLTEINEYIYKYYKKNYCDLSNEFVTYFYHIKI